MLACTESGLDRGHTVNIEFYLILLYVTELLANPVEDPVLYPP
jgi:hypothetical protein